VRALGGLALVVRAIPERVADVDLLDHQDFVFQVDLAFGLGGEPPLTRIDPARLQRAAQGAGESTSGRRDHVVEGRRVVGVLAGRRPVVFAHRAVRAEYDWLRLSREVRLPNGPALADDPHL